MWSSNLDSSATFEGGFANNSTREDQDATKTRRAQTTVPVMIRHLLSTGSTEDVTIWGIPVRMFSLVAIVRNVEETATKISYNIEDETGTIVALKWLEADRKATDRTMSVNTYIRLVGLLREQNDKRHVLILRMWPLQSLNELTNHILEVTYVALKAESMAKQNNELGHGNGNMSMSSAKPVEDSADYGMTSEQSLIYKIIHAQNDTESGIERSEIKAKAPKTILSRVDTILDFLVSEGHIYTTSTDDHFKTT